MKPGILKYISFDTSQAFENWQENNKVKLMHVAPLLPTSDVWVIYTDDIPEEFYE